jgi:hypothetical protein
MLEADFELWEIYTSEHNRENAETNLVGYAAVVVQ